VGDEQMVKRHSSSSTSGTKYFGGHSDLLSGILVVKTIEEWKTVYPTCNFNQSNTE